MFREPELAITAANIFVRELNRLQVTGEGRGNKCLWRVVGRRCRRGYRFGTCLCYGDSGDWWDHPRLLRTAHGPVLISQPYGVRDLTRLRAWAAEHGAVVEVHPERSWHYPGRTTLITVARG